MEVTRLVRDKEDGKMHQVKEKLKTPRTTPIAGERIIAYASGVSHWTDCGKTFLYFYRSDNTKIGCQFTFHDEKQRKKFDKYFTWVTEARTRSTKWGEMIFLIGCDESTGAVEITTPVISPFDVNYTFPLDVSFQIIESSH